MSQGVPDLLRQGLIITVLGMGLVFATLGLLWGIIVLLTRIFRDPPAETLPEINAASVGLAHAGVLIDDGDAGALTVERARVAAIVAGALIANAVPLLMEAPPGPLFEHGRTAPIWVSANRARALQSWQPQRVTEAQPRISGD